MGGASLGAGRPSVEGFPVCGGAEDKLSMAFSRYRAASVHVGRSPPPRAAVLGPARLPRFPVTRDTGVRSEALSPETISGTANKLTS